MNGDAIGQQVVKIARAKQDLSPRQAFFRGVLCNLLPVIAGNLVGGSVLVGLAYHVIYRRVAPVAARTSPAAPPAPNP